MPHASEVTEGESESEPRSSRSRREKKDKHGRKAVLEKLKEAKSKGERLRYEVTDVNNVYDIVDEKEYEKKVRERQVNDWIVDDGQGDYYEDGREVFDEENDEFQHQKMDIEEDVKKLKNTKKKIKVVKSSDIKTMFSSMGANKKMKEKSAELGQDELLGDILQEISTSKDDSLSVPRQPILLKKKRSIFQPESVLPISRSEIMSPPSSLCHKNTKPRRIMAPVPISSSTDYCKVEPPPEPMTPPAKRSKLDVHQENDLNKSIKPADFIEVKSENCNMDMNDIDFDDDFGCKQEENDKSAIEKEPKKEFSTSNLSTIGWETIKQESVSSVVEEPEVVVDSTQLPLVTDGEGNQVFRFFWFDAHEDMYRQPGIVYLFGKVYIEKAQAHVSCCLTVKNIERSVYFLPREKNLETGEEVSLQDVYQEFDTKVAERYKIMKFKTKVVDKKYVFGESDIPEHSQYLEIRYPSEYTVLPTDLSGNTFSHAFGTNQSALEALLLRRCIKGPCWIDVKMPQLNSQSVSWCKIEAWVSSPIHMTPIKDISLPPLVVLAVATKTYPNLKTHQNEVVAIAGLIHHKFSIDKPPPKPNFQHTFCAIGKPADCVFPYNLRDVIKKRGVSVELASSERMLLGFFLAKVQKIDPDIIIGHNLHDFDINVMLHRISTYKIANWSRLGRLKRVNLPKQIAGGRFLDRAITCGRLLCDMKIVSKELIRCKNYELETLADQVLHTERQPFPPEQIKNMFCTSEQMMWLMEHTWMDASLALSLSCELNVLPLAHQITTIAGNVMSRTLMGGRSERNEFLLLHAFHERDFIPPDKVYKKSVQSQKTTKSGAHDLNETSGKPKNKKGTSYAGGLVLEPKKGFYDKYILLLDFNSLYPSIIQEYNICFTTLDRHPPPGAEVDEDSYIPEIPETGLEPGVLPTEIKKLVDRRRTVKQLMKDSSLSKDEYIQYNIRQQALKLTANSMYGCLGFTGSRFYAKPLAALVTRQGREILLHTKELAQKMNLDVIYGDTDSIMINTNSTDLEQVYKLGNQVKSEVNKLYRLLEIDIDGIFKSMLLLKKKKYAALTVHKNPDGSYSTKKEMKGLDIVRRDWSELAKMAGNYAVEEILSDQSREKIVENIHAKLEEIGKKVKDGDYPLDVYIINKELTKDPHQYPAKNSLPHVIVALRLNQNMSKHLKSGDVVSYIICKDSTNTSAAQRAYSVDEIKKDEKLKVDDHYYLAHQVHPVVMRLCEPVDGTDSARIAQFLGLDATSYKQSMGAQEEDEEDRLLSVQATEEERFSDCDPVIFTCPESGKKISLKSGVFAETDPTWKPTLLLECGQNDTKEVVDFLPQFQNQLTMQIRAYIDKYYNSWLNCDDPACSHRTRTIPTVYDKQGLPCPLCKKGVLRPEYTYKRLYQQLCYYKLQFDVDYALRKYKQDSNNSKGCIRVQEHRSEYNLLTETIENFLNQSAYNQVCLPELFSWMVKAN